MKLTRQQFVHLAAGAVALQAVARLAWAQTYPSRPVRIIVGFPPGGPSDIAARLIGQWLSERMGQPFIIESRPGGGGNIATEAVVKASPDGYTLLLVPSGSAVNATLYQKLNFNFVRDIAPVAGIIRIPLVMAVNAAVPAATVPELIAYAKANPGKINFASPGNGTTAHVAGELFKMMAGVDIVHVPYRGSAPALTDLLGGQVQAIFDTPATLLEHIRTGRLRGLAVGTVARAQALPDVPPMGDFLPGYEASAWFGVGAPKSTPPDIIERLNTEINAGLVDPRVKARLTDLGGAVFASSSAEFDRFIGDEIGKWGKVVKFAGITPE